MTAIPASTFADSVGLCIHPNYLTAQPAWNNPAWPDLVIASGVKHVRGTVGHNKAVLPFMQKLASAGVKMCVMALPGHDISPGEYAAFKTDIDFLANSIGAANLTGIESANEYNHGHPANWVADLRAVTQWLHQTVRANPNLNGVPVVAPSVWGRIPADYKALGNLAPNIENGCIHYYPAGRRPTRSVSIGGPEYSIADAFRDAHIIAPNLPLYATEYGYEPALADKGIAAGGYFVPMNVACKYLLRGLFDTFAAGAKRTYIYELIDSMSGHYWGLCDANLKPRPTYTAVKNLMALVNDTGTAATPLDYTLSVTTADVRQMLLSKADGSHLLVLYRDVDSYNRSTHKEIAVAPVNVTVRLNRAASFKVYRPTFDASVQQVGSGTTLNVSIGDEVTIVAISADTVTAPPPVEEPVPPVTADDPDVTEAEALISKWLDTRDAALHDLVLQLQAIFAS